MRDIKFRAWDKELKEFVDTNNTAIAPTNGDVIEVGGYELLDVNHFAILEQYTGLKDKNGVEIYEGDIVQVRSHLYKDHIGAIIWSQGTAGFCISDNTNKFNIPRPLGIQMDGFLSYEVVGNIHENAELLEEQS